VWAGITGKVAGAVTDTDGTPLPGVAVTVDGTRLGATTDTDGRYFILQVPPGEQTVSAQLIGFRRSSVANLRVSADLTTQVDITLTEEAITVGDVMVTAERPPIDVDLTSSQTIVDAQRVSEAPVSTMLDYLRYEPGVNIVRDNEFEIRGGGASEIRFQVDGLDRTDALSRKAYAQLNQVMVSEVTVLTGGFNAEYGDMRSGVVNAVMKDGTEGRTSLPWLSGVYSMSPAQKKHFGPGAYDSDQYDYWLMSQSNSGNSFGSIYWPDLYTNTANDPVLSQIKADNGGEWPAEYSAFDGWQARADFWNAQPGGAYGKSDWTAQDLYTAWTWEANQNEAVWEYGHEPDWNADMALGWALPSNLGGVIVGFAHNKEMTPFPTMRSDFSDQTIDAKLTLTPVDQLKLQISYMTGQSRSTGASGGGDVGEADLEQGLTGVSANAPQAVRDPSTLLSSVAGATEYAANNKLHLYYNSPLDGDFTQWGTSLTYTLGPSTYITMRANRVESQWEQARPKPRVNLNDFSGGYSPNNSFAWGGEGGFLDVAYNWEDLDPDAAVLQNYPLNASQVTADNIIPRGPFFWPEPYPIDDVPTLEAVYVENTTLVPGATLVAPLGWVEREYSDLSDRFTISGSNKTVSTSDASRTVLGASLVHARGDHTMKLGAEYLSSDISYLWYQTYPIEQLYSRMRDYEGQPKYLGLFLQDKYESGGLIANVGVRAEMYDNGGMVYFPHQLFSDSLYQGGYLPIALDVLREVLNDPTIDLSEAGTIVSGSDPPITPADVRAALPQESATVRWRLAPRLGISHPVGVQTKVFFNYGQFYQMPKPNVLYGLGTYEMPMGNPNSQSRDIEYANLRPIRTSMYEAGVERVLAQNVLMTVRGYAKYNVDQVGSVQILAPRAYTSYRNSNWEDIRGLEIKFSRFGGRFVNGWTTYDYIATRSGWVGLQTLNPDPLVGSEPYGAQAQTNKPTHAVRAFLQVGTPLEWGLTRGGWAVGVLQDWRQGSEIIYNPQGLQRRELPDENIMRFVDYWNTDLKISKTLPLAGGRSLQLYADVTNVLNAKRLALGAVDTEDYYQYVVDRRLAGETDLRVGDDSTLDALTEPYQDTGGNWKAPISPRTEWLHYLNPRAFRFGLRFDL